MRKGVEVKLLNANKEKEKSPQFEYTTLLCMCIVYFAPTLFVPDGKKKKNGTAHESQPRGVEYQ